MASHGNAARGHGHHGKAVTAKKKKPKATTVPAVPRVGAGRPSIYTQELAMTICRRIAEGESLRSICRDDGMPSVSTVMLWALSMPQFSEQYTRARELQAEVHIDEIIDIADDGHNDYMLKNHGDNVAWVENGEALRRSQIRIEARKWTAAKLLPKKYGDRIKVDTERDLLTAMDGMSEDELKLIAEIAARRATRTHFQSGAAEAGGDRDPETAVDD